MKMKRMRSYDEAERTSHTFEVIVVEPELHGIAPRKRGSTEMRRDLNSSDKARRRTRDEKGAGDSGNHNQQR